MTLRTADFSSSVAGGRKGVFRRAGGVVPGRHQVVVVELLRGDERVRLGVVATTDTVEEAVVVGAFVRVKVLDELAVGFGVSDRVVHADLRRFAY
jgi:hypothetical protein